MYFLFVRSVLVVPLPVVAACRQPRGSLVSRNSSRVVSAMKRAMSGWQDPVAIFSPGETSCQ
jgi:hypothetical protein